MTRTDIETALDNHKLWCRMATGRYWACKRNGKTRTWKRDAARWEIPIKIGYKTYGLITPESIASDELTISDGRP